MIFRVDAIGFRKFQLSSSINSECSATSETRLSGLNCTCRLGGSFMIPCRSGTKSFCIGGGNTASSSLGTCKCTGGDVIDCVTGKFCHAPLRISPPSTLTICSVTSGSPAVTVAGIPSTSNMTFGGQPRTPISCTYTIGTSATPVTYLLAYGSATSPTGSAMSVDPNTGKIIWAPASAAITIGTTKSSPITWTCKDQCGSSATATTTLSESTTAAVACT